MVETLAAVAVRPREIELRSIPLPEIAPDAGLLRIEATGVCGSDWPMYLSEKAGPRILGHEMVGTIERIGPRAAERWGANEGDRVALEEYLPCGHCDYCRSGEFRSCAATDSRLSGAIRYGSTGISVGSGLWGGYSRYLHMHPRTVLHHVPEGVPSHIAAMAIPIGNGFQWAWLDGGAGPGKTVVVLGPGQNGLSCVMAAKVAGAERVIAVGLAHDAHRLVVARALGADLTIVADSQEVHEVVAEATGGRMADLVIETTSAGPEIVNQALTLVRKRGTLALVSRKGGRGVPAFDIDRLVGMQLTVKGLRGHSYQAVELALSTMASGRFPIERLSSHILGLGEVDRALRAIGGEAPLDAIHISIDPWRSDAAS